MLPNSEPLSLSRSELNRRWTDGTPSRSRMLMNRPTESIAMPAVCNPTALVPSNVWLSRVCRPSWNETLYNALLYLSGPDATPPSDRFVYSAPRARAAGSVHCSCGALPTKLMPRLRKLEPEPERMLKLAPLNPPLETSYGDVVSDVEMLASRGNPFAPTCSPLSVTLF